VPPKRLGSLCRVDVAILQDGSEVRDVEYSRTCTSETSTNLQQNQQRVTMKTGNQQISDSHAADTDM
jgi:hypothetical protein